MTNFEKYKDQILELGSTFAVVGGQPTACRVGTPCNVCELGGHAVACNMKRVKWLAAEAEEEKEITSHVEAAVDVLNAIANEPDTVIKTNALCLIAFNTASIADALEDIRDMLGDGEDEQAD